MSLSGVRQILTRQIACPAADVHLPIEITANKICKCFVQAPSPISNNDSRKKLTLSETFGRITRSDQVARTQNVDDIAVAMVQVFSIPSKLPGIRGPLHQIPEPFEPATGNPEELAIRALSGFTWSEDDNLSGARTERGQNLLHICAIGNYQNLLQFLFERGFDDRAKRQAKDDTGRTALQISEEMGRKGITSMLSSSPGVTRSLPKGSGIPTEYVLCIGPHKPCLIS